MAETDLQSAQVFGEQGEPCQECGAPLAADQRYCVNCGKRRAGPRVDYRELMGSRRVQPPADGPPSSPAAAAAPPPQPEKSERDYAPLAAVGGIAVLGLMLLVGVLIGKGNSTTPASAPAPIVKFGEPPGGSTASAESSESESAGKESKGSKKAKKGGGTGAETVAGGLTGSAARNSEATVQASTDDLEALQNQSGDSYQETIKKLPDKIATPGKPPPIDTSTAPGGGGAAETIE